MSGCQTWFVNVMFADKLGSLFCNNTHELGKCVLYNAMVLKFRVSVKIVP